MIHLLNETIHTLAKDIPPTSSSNAPIIPLELPEDLHLSSNALRPLLQALCTEPLNEVYIQSIPMMVQSIRLSVEPSSTHAPVLWIWVERALFKLWLTQEPLDDLRCNRCWHAPRSCPHVLALYVALTWHTPKLRKRFFMSQWEGALKALLPSQEHAPLTFRPNTAHTGERPHAHVRYTLHPDLIVHPPKPTTPQSTRRGTPVSNPFPDMRKFVDRSIIIEPDPITGKRPRGGKKRRFPASFEDANAQWQGLTPEDEQIDLLLERLRAIHELTKAKTRQRRPQALHKLIGDCVDELLQTLSTCPHVSLPGDMPARVTQTPLSPEIEATLHDDQEHIQLSFTPTIRTTLTLPKRTWILLRDGTFAPLAKSFPNTMMAALARNSLPLVPLDEFDRFVEVFVHASPVPVHLDTHSKLGVLHVEHIEPRLVLHETPDGALRIEPTFAYHTPQGPILPIPHDDPRSVLLTTQDDTDTDVLVIQRDFTRERTHIHSLIERLNQPLPLLFTGEPAYDFLSNTLPTLTDTWTIYGQKDLQKHHVRPPLEPTITYTSGLDWFDLHVQFQTDDQTVSLADLLTTLQTSSRYHILQDGSLAKLPDAWLARHHAHLDELEHARKATKRKLRPHHTPIALSLLDELALDPETTDDQRSSLQTWRDLPKSLASFDAIPKLSLQTPPNAKLRDYQRDGVRWLTFLRDHNLGGILADDMGLGKTLQTLTLLLDTHSKDPDALSIVVAPLSVLHNWQREAQRFTPSLRTHIHHGNHRETDPFNPQRFDLIITTYGTLRADASLLCDHTWRCVILDEAQAIKNPQSQVARVARSLPGQHRFALTGTPVENNLLDLFSIFQFILPGFFPSKAHFNRTFAKPIQNQTTQTQYTQKTKHEALQRLKLRTRPFILRRLKSDVASDLPPRQEQVLYCELPPAQARIYKEIKDSWRDTILQSLDTKGVRGSTLTILEALMRLRQACCDARLLPSDLIRRRPPRSAKLTLLLDTLTSIMQSGHRSLIFSQWPSMLKLIAEDLDKHDIPYLYLDGSTRNRHNLVSQWNDPNGPPVFLISLKAGGSGLNLTGADHVFHIDPWWNPAVEDQATDRAHRIGQTKPVVAYKLIAQDTVEEKILELQNRKRALIESTLDADTTLVESLTREDIVAVFS